MKKLLLILIVVSAGIAVVYLLNRPAGTTTSSGSMEISSSPGGESSSVDFALEDLSGKTVRLSDYRGKPVLVVFFATWCPPCKMEIPHLKKIYENEIVDILAVDVGESAGKVERFVKDQGIPYRVLVDERSVVGSKFRVSGIPTTLFVNPDGSVHHRFSGYDPKIENLVRDWVGSINPEG